MSAPPDTVRPATSTRALASGLAVALSIARVEGPRLLRHPTTLVGGALSLLFLATLLAAVAPVLQRDVLMIAATSMPLAVGVALAAHLAASRPRRDDLEVLVATAPSTPASRTLGLLVALLWPAVGASVWTMVLLVGLRLLGGIGLPASGDVVALSGTVLLFGAFGVALGRWAPAATAGAFGTVLAGIGMFVAAAAAQGGTGERLLPWADWGAFRAVLMIEAWPRAPWWHLAYVVATAAAVACVALLADRRRWSTVAATAVAGTAAVALAVPMLDVWDDDLVEELIADVREPDRRLVCTLEQNVEVCLPDGYEGWQDRLRDPVVRVVAAVTPALRPDTITVEMAPQGLHYLGDTIPAERAVALPGDVQDAIADVRTQAPDDPSEPGVLPASLNQQSGVGGQAQRLDLAVGAAAEVTGFRDTALGRLVTLGYLDVDELDDHLAAGTSRERLEQAITVELDPSPRGTPLDHTDGCVNDREAQEVLTFALAAASDIELLDTLADELERSPYGWVPMGPGGGLGFDDWWRLGFAPATSPGAASGVVVFGPTGPYSRGGAQLGWQWADHLMVRDRADRRAHAIDLGELVVDWDRWTDPRVSADELVDAFGLSPLPGPDEQAADAGLDDRIVGGPCR